MSPVKPGRVYIVPEWFGLEPKQAQDAITQLLERAGALPSEGCGTSFTLNVRAVGSLRRDGVAIRNQRAVRSSYEAALSNRAHVAAVRSWLAMTRASVLGHQASLASRGGHFGQPSIVCPRPIVWGETPIRSIEVGSRVGRDGSGALSSGESAKEDRSPP